MSMPLKNIIGMRVNVNGYKMIYTYKGTNQGIIKYLTSVGFKPIFYSNGNFSPPYFDNEYVKTIDDIEGILKGIEDIEGIKVTENGDTDIYSYFGNDEGIIDYLKTKGFKGRESPHATYSLSPTEPNIAYVREIKVEEIEMKVISKIGEIAKNIL